jgi:tetratricopeptide (TPR) repeat protein
MNVSGSDTHGDMSAGRTFSVQPATVAESDLRLAEQLNKLAWRYRENNQLDEAEALYLRALSLRGAQPGISGMAELTALKSLGELYAREARPDRAETLFRKVVEHLEGCPDDCLKKELSGVLRLLALALKTQEKHGQAEQVLTHALAGLDYLTEPAEAETALVLKELAGLYLGDVTSRQGPSALAAQGLPLAYGLYELGSFYLKQACYEESHYYLRLAVKQVRDGEVYCIFDLPTFTRGKISADVREKLKAVSLSYRALGKSQCGSGDFRQGRETTRKALAMALAVLPETHPHILLLTDELCELELILDNSCAARVLAEQALAQRKRLLGDDHPQLAGGFSLLARAYLAGSDERRAEELLRGAYDLLLRSGSQGSLATALVLKDLALIFLARGELEQARNLSLRAISISEAAGDAALVIEPAKAERQAPQTGEFMPEGNYEQAVLRLVASGLNSLEISRELKSSNVAVAQALSKVQAELAALPAQIACARLSDKLAV